MNIKFEIALIDHLGSIMEVVNLAVEKMRANGNMQWGEEYPREKDFIKDIESSCLYIIKDSEKIIGTGSMNTEQAKEYDSVVWGSYETAFVLHRLIINPEYQGKGIGYEFAKFFEKKALENNIKYLRLDAYSLNINANRLYQKLGYTLRGFVYFRNLENHFNCYEKYIGDESIMDKDFADIMVFVKEIDKMKSIYRQTMLMDLSRNENDAEHSWHLSMLAVLLRDYSNEKIDLLKVIKMVIIHDIVEIDAEDTFLYDEKGNADKKEREIKAANRLFGMLPTKLKEEFMNLWLEFEERNTPESKFAASLDRVQPMINNFYTEGSAWIKHGIYKHQVIKKNGHIIDGSLKLWDFASNLINEATKRGYLKKQ